jgi:hypothetical protein
MRFMGFKDTQIAEVMVMSLLFWSKNRRRLEIYMVPHRRLRNVESITKKRQKDERQAMSHETPATLISISSPYYLSLQCVESQVLKPPERAANSMSFTVASC